VTSACRVGLVLVLMVVFAGCSGGGEEQENLFTAADATRLAQVRPDMPGWDWPENPEKKRRSSSDAVTKAAADDPLAAELQRQTADLVELGDDGNRWRDENKTANLAVGVFASASDAHEYMAPFNAFSRGWAVVAGTITKDEEIEGLGDEAWVLRVGGSANTVTYHWRRANLFVEAHIDCFGPCPGNVEQAAREWADAIDDEATSG
jgi:hypothetical protein